MNCVGQMAEFTSDEINSQVPKMLICERTFEMPKDKEREEALKDALSLADNEISIVRYMLNSERVKKSYWNGSYSGGAAVKNKKIAYSFTLRVRDDKIIGCGQVNKEIYKDIVGGKRDLSKRFRIMHFDKTNIVKTFTYGHLDTKKYFEFYPNGNLKHCMISLSNKNYRGYWDENGNLADEIVRIKDWDKEKIISEKRRAEFKKKSDERIQAKKDFVRNHPELKKIMDEITDTGKQFEKINKKLKSDSYSVNEISSMKSELIALSNKYINCFFELKKVQKQIIEEEKEK
jgi:hypothetical protein